MKVGIMQPYFFPYLGYWQLINAVDAFVLLEDVQFINHGWIERNRIVNFQGEWSYIKVPLLQHKRETLIKDIKIKNSDKWREKIKSQLVHYKKRARYYNETIDLVNEALNIKTSRITELNFHSLKTVCNYLDIKTKIEIFDMQENKMERPTAPDEWALNICVNIGGVDTYINPEGGQNFFNTEKYKSNSIDVKFLKVNLNPYNQKKKDFIPGLSIIDVLMFNSKEDVKKMLLQYTVVE